jgi:4-diphosphocytidyl-2-C-methyl-D-erythritol kinase
MTMFKKVFSPAKINLCLHVLGKRADGYHDVAMLMQRITLFDRIDVKLIEGNDVIVTCPGVELPVGEQNITERAARLLLRHVDREQGVSIAVEKHIPAAAGLGGGSSDAAAVLQVLDELLELQLPRAELMDLGMRLGADVPFFLFGQTAWATGIGERLEAWRGMPPSWLVLVNPRVAVSTAWAYQNLGLTHTRAAAKIPKFPEGIRGLVRLLHNDLEAVTTQRHPVIDEIKQFLLNEGACGALMSGSGPTVFGVFDNLVEAEQAALTLAETHGWWTKVVTPLE